MLKKSLSLLIIIIIIIVSEASTVLTFKCKLVHLQPNTMRSVYLYLPDCRKIRYVCVQQYKAVLWREKRVLSLGSHTEDSVVGLSVKCQRINCGLRTTALFFGCWSRHTQRRITSIAYARVRWKEDEAQARWNVKGEQNYKKMEILQWPDLKLECSSRYYYGLHSLQKCAMTS